MATLPSLGFLGPSFPSYLKAGPLSSGLGRTGGRECRLGERRPTC